MAVCQPRTGSCSLERDPGSSRFCYWHRVSYAPMRQQIDAAKRRIDTPALIDQNDGQARRCVDCGPVPGWYMGKAKRQPRCVACQSRYNADARREKLYGLTVDQHQELLRRQGGRCGICGDRQNTRTLAIDHNHQTGAVRGLLCLRCNHLLLGGGKDSVRIIASALSYLLGGDRSMVALVLREVARIVRLPRDVIELTIGKDGPNMFDRSESEETDR